MPNSSEMYRMILGFSQNAKEALSDNQMPFVVDISPCIATGVPGRMVFIKTES